MLKNKATRNISPLSDWTKKKKSKKIFNADDSEYICDKQVIAKEKLKLGISRIVFFFNTKLFSVG